MKRIRDLARSNEAREAGLAKLPPPVPRIAAGKGSRGVGNGAEAVFRAFADAVDHCGFGSPLVCELSRGWAESRYCASCAECVQSCPSGALAMKGPAAEEMMRRTETIARLAAANGVQA